MTHSRSSKPRALPPGLYEALVTDALARRMEAAREAGSHLQDEPLDPGDGYEALARHLFEALRRHLRSVPHEDRVGRQARLVNALLEQLHDAGEGLAVREPARLLEAVAGPEDALPGRPGEAPRAAFPTRPQVPLSQSDLLVNARGEPGVGQALEREIPSADRIDLLCAFIRWNGLRVLLPVLKAHRERGRPLRVLTTTYVGATERRALDALASLGAEIRVSYETRTTRLHAKAWLLRRESGFTTAFVGSSNLSRSALLDGLEWNVRLSAVANPEVLEKFAATFESYWEDGAFEAYDPSRDGERLDRALRQASRGGPRAAGAEEPGALATTALDVHPYPHQREILERLAVERERHGRHRSLVVAATGTGKTVVAALDYRRLCEAARPRERGAARPRLLFVAHRKEILAQSLRTFRDVLKDGEFGEPYVDGRRPDAWRHVFASVQSLSRIDLDRLDPAHFEVVIVDEFHHAAAPTYDRLLRHLRPRELLGLTATPERADGRSVLEWFDERIAAEIRVWEALDRQLLCPFQYFGTHDGVDLSGLRWRRGGYETADLERVYTGNDMRVRLVLQALRERVADPLAMRALGFCVSIAHAEFMARRFREAGIPARAVSAESSREERDAALEALREREASVLFAVDLFNEGIDVPEIDTVLFLRPTESPTVFLQQLGRGLRHAPEAGKSCLTVLDFIGQAHRRFRYDRRFRALTGASRGGLRRALEQGFPYLPAGCTIQLERKAREHVLENLRRAVGTSRRSLADELRALGRDVPLEAFLREADLEIEELYRSPGWTWTALRRDAGLPAPGPGPAAHERALAHHLPGLLHWDDPERLATGRRWLAGPEPPRADALPERERRMALALVFALFGYRRRWERLQDALDAVFACPAYLAELRELLPLLEDRAAHLGEPLRDVLPGFDARVPLSLHSRYTQAEILSAFDLMNLEHPHPVREGVKYDPETGTDLLFVTLEKSERHYSPTTLYRDYALSPRRFHWESQSTTTAQSPTGRRYIHHAERGTHVLLFVRPRAREGGRTLPYAFLGPARYEHHTGERPMAIVWRLAREIPADLYGEARLAAG